MGWEFTPDRQAQYYVAEGITMSQKAADFALRATKPGRDATLPDVSSPNGLLPYDPNAGTVPRTGGVGRFFGLDELSAFGATRSVAHSTANRSFAQGNSYAARALAMVGLYAYKPKVSFISRSHHDVARPKKPGAMGQSSATEYAKANHWVMPAFPPEGGWEWCHLQSHGSDGANIEDNFVCGTHACNSEQLEWESWLYDEADAGRQYFVTVRAVIAPRTLHLAEYIEYSVYLIAGHNQQGEIVYWTRFDARRPDEPSSQEKMRLRAMLTDMANAARRRVSGP